MMIRLRRFNIYLGAVLSAALMCGCNTPARKEEKALATLRFYLETNAHQPDQSSTVAVNRSHPVAFTIQKVPCLTEANIRQAKVLDGQAGFELQVQFDKDGTILIEELTAGNPEKHFVIFSQFPTPPEYKLNQGRWLAAPLISAKITDGVFKFTPDATHQEAEWITLGLGHVAKAANNGPVLNW
jgi:hypothetical protein